MPSTSIYLTDEQFNKAKTMAEKENISFSAFVANLIDEAEDYEIPDYLIEALNYEEDEEGN